MDKHDLMCISLYTKMNNNELKECIQKMAPMCHNNAQGFCLTVAGYDEDSRELWEIPDVIRFMKKLCDIGFISVLEVATSCPELASAAFKTVSGTGQPPGFGALEVWMCATNRLGDGKTDIDQPTMNLFLAELQSSNRKCQAICQEPPYSTGIIQNEFQTFVSDGAIKHSGYQKDKIPSWMRK